MAERLKSRKFWMAVVGAILIIANDGLGLNIPREVVIPFAALLIAYILGEAAVDVARAIRK